MDEFSTVIVVTLAVLAALLISYAPELKAKKHYGKECFVAYAKLEHTYGLNFPQGTKVGITFLLDRILFNAHNQELSLSESKLVDVSTMKLMDIQKQYVSSAGGAITGAMIAGPLGAMVGGRAKVRNIKSRSKYLVIAYKDTPDSPESKYITFDITSANYRVKSIPRHYRYLSNTQSDAVEL